MNKKTLLSRILILCIASLCAVAVYADIICKGKVVDAGTLSPLPGVAVFVKDTEAVAATNANGEYTITAPDESMLTFVLSGYEPLTIKAKQNMGATTMQSTEDVPAELSAPQSGSNRYTGPCPLTLDKVSVTNVGLNKRMLRMDDNGLIVDNAGMCLEVTVAFSAKGIPGRRVICELTPLDANDNYFVDSKGEVAAMEGVTIPSSDWSGKVMIPLPYTWVVTDENKKLGYVKLGVTLAMMGEEEIKDTQIVKIANDDMKLSDKKNLGNKLMGDLFGGSSSGGGGLMGGLLGAMLDTSDGEITQKCPNCDGTGVCSHCDGDGFFDPQVCRKCANDPGICRRCKGEGEITVKYDVY